MCPSLSSQAILLFTSLCLSIFASANSSTSAPPFSFQKISTRDVVPHHSFLQLSPQTQELIRQGAASISYVPVQLDGRAETVPKSSIWQNHSRNVDKMSVVSAPILPNPFGGVKSVEPTALHSIPLSYKERNWNAQGTLSPLPLVQHHIFPSLQNLPLLKSAPRDLTRPADIGHPSSGHLVSSGVQVPKRTHIASLDDAAAIVAQLHRLRALQAASISRRKLEGATIPLEHFSPPAAPWPENKPPSELPPVSNWKAVLPDKGPPAPTPADNYCSLHHFPQSRLDEVQLQRLDSHFIYNKSCSPQFFQCSMGQTFVLNCPGDDQAFDPAISSCNFKNSIKLCPEYDRVLHCSIREYCTSNQFACCALPQQCIDLHRRCDGHRDCADGEDENNCPSCARNEFACVKNGLCIPAKKRCDGRVDDCMDGSNLDEIGCSKNETCWGKFVCDSQATLSATGHSVCLDWARHCDGHRDCAGGEDELNCKLMEAKYLLCENQKQSVGKEQWCNGKEDCLDGSDEKYCY